MEKDRKIPAAAASQAPEHEGARGSHGSRTSAAGSRPAVRVALISAGTWAIAAAVRNAVIELKREPSPQRDIWEAGLVARPVESPDGVADEAADIQPLPSAPSDAEKYLYVERRKALLLFLSMLSFGGLLASQVRFASSSPGLVALFPLIAFTLIYYVIALVVNLPTRGFDVQEHERLVQSWRPRRYPSVDVFLPSAGEPLDVLANTFLHVSRMSGPAGSSSTCWTTRLAPRCATSPPATASGTPRGPTAAR